MDTLKATDSFLDQVKILAALDYYSDKVLWTNGNFYFAEDERFQLNATFFIKNRLLYNIQRYIYNNDSNIIYNLMKDVLPYDSKIGSIIKQILVNV